MISLNSAGLSGSSCTIKCTHCKGTGDALQPYRDASANVLDELAKAVGRWPRFNSLHEGWGVLSEEVDELWEHVRLNQKKRDPAAMRAEAIQVAAMALRIAVECSDEVTIRK